MQRLRTIHGTTVVVCAITIILILGNISPSLARKKVIKIVGTNNGTVVEDPSKWPFFVTIKYGKSNVYCGGTIVSEKLIVTSNSCHYLHKGHATIYSNSVSRAEGDKNLQINNSTYFCNTGEYKYEPSINGRYKSTWDFIMMAVNGTQTLTGNHSHNKPIKVKKVPLDIMTREDASCYIVTNLINKDGMRVVSAPVKYKPCWVTRRSKDQFCFEGDGVHLTTCEHDSGSPIVCHDESSKSYVLVGIVATLMPTCNLNNYKKGIYNIATNMTYMYEQLLYDRCITKLGDEDVPEPTTSPPKPADDLTKTKLVLKPSKRPNLKLPTFKPSKSPNLKLPTMKPSKSSNLKPPTMKPSKSSNSKLPARPSKNSKRVRKVGGWKWGVGGKLYIN